MPNGRTLLAICTLPPWPVTNGYALRVNGLLRALAARWRITLLAPVGRQGPLPADIAEHVAIDLRGSGLTYPWRFDGRALHHAATALAASRSFGRALVWPGAEAVWFGTEALPPGVMDMIDCNPLEFWRTACLPGASARERLRSVRELGIAAVFARRTVRRFGATVCVGEQDAAWLRRIGGRDRVHVVRSGVALPPASSLLPETVDPAVSFIGTLDYPPNVDAVRFLTGAIWPLVRAQVPAARLLVAGRNPVAAIAALDGRDGMEVAADVPDTTAVLSRSWVSVAPMRTGVGIKNKVLEAWACGRPVVMTGRATNGLVLPPGHARLVQEGAPALAAQIVALLQDADARRALGNAARAHAARCSWAAAADQLDELLLAAGPPLR